MQLVFQFNSFTSLADLGGLCDPSVVSVSPVWTPARAGADRGRAGKGSKDSQWTNEELTQVTGEIFSNCYTTEMQYYEC